MKKYVVVKKRVGQTPLQAVQQWQKENPDWALAPAAYAGRLDPMASGKLLVLLGEECKRIKEYTGLDKEYVIEVILGIGSDSGDVLGIVEAGASIPALIEAKEKIRKVLAQEIGVHDRAYPVYSSKTINGIPLFQYALTNRLTEITIPTHKETIYSISCESIETWGVEKLSQHVHSYLSVVPFTDEPSKVDGRNFRIEDVRNSWNQFFGNSTADEFTVLRLRVSCGSGVYMRTLAGRIGEAFGTKGLALSIDRTKIGRFKKMLGLSFWASKLK